MPMYTQRSTLTQKVLGYGGLAAILLIVLIPYTYIALTAFKPAEEIFDVRWLPRVWSLDAWRYAIEFEQFHVYIYNSMIAGLAPRCWRCASPCRAPTSSGASSSAART